MTAILNQGGGFYHLPPFLTSTIMGQNHLFINHTKKEIHEVEVLRENVKPYEDGLGLLWYLLESYNSPRCLDSIL